MWDIFGNGSNVNNFFTKFKLLIFNFKFFLFKFEYLAINRLFEKIIPINSRNNDFSSVSRNIFMDLYWSRYSGLKALLEGYSY